ncbi:hypothetical protein PR048_013435, partial [Dryococelus australis]
MYELLLWKYQSMDFYKLAPLLLIPLSLGLMILTKRQVFLHICSKSVPTKKTESRTKKTQFSKKTKPTNEPSNESYTSRDLAKPKHVKKVPAKKTVNPCKRLKRNKVALEVILVLTDDEDSADEEWVFCNQPYKEDYSGDQWIRCIGCLRWVHELCAGVEKRQWKTYT